MVNCNHCNKEYETEQDMMSECYFISPGDGWTWEYEHKPIKAEDTGEVAGHE